MYVGPPAPSARGNQFVSLLNRGVSRPKVCKAVLRDELGLCQLVQSSFGLRNSRVATLDLISVELGPRDEIRYRGFGVMAGRVCNAARPGRIGASPIVFRPRFFESALGFPEGAAVAPTHLATRLLQCGDPL